MKAESAVPFVEEVATGKVVTGLREMTIEEAAKSLTSEQVNSLLIVDDEGALVGILTSWDIAKAVGTGARSVGEVMTKRVVVAHKGEPIDLAARKLEKHGISALPIIDGKRRILGLISDEDIARFVGRKKW
jgi:CBS domain-containing protein